jgi:hypothetical protein
MTFTHKIPTSHGNKPNKLVIWSAASNHTAEVDLGIAKQAHFHIAVGKQP